MCEVRPRYICDDYHRSKNRLLPKEFYVHPPGKRQCNVSTMNQMKRWKFIQSFANTFLLSSSFFFSLLLCSPCSTLRESFLGAENVSQLDNTSSLYHDGVTYYFRCTGCLQRRKLSSSFARRKSHQHRRVLIASLRTRSRSHRLTELDKVSAFII